MRILLVFALLFGFQNSGAEGSLCVGNEKIVFSCHSHLIEGSESLGR